MRARSLLLGIDAGTSTCKAALYGLDGRLVALAAEPAPTVRPRPGWVEQDPEGLWRAVVAAIRTALARTEARPEEIAGVCACGHSPTLILLDSEGKPTRPAIVWQDTRAGQEAREIAAALGDELPEHLGFELPLSPSFAPGRLFWLRRNEPGPLDRAARALEPKDYVHYRLTGVAASDPWACKGLISLRSRRFVALWPGLLGVGPEILPEIAEPHAAIGGVTPRVADELGLRSGTPVATGWTDGLCSMLGAGVFVGEGLGFLVSGTSDVLGVVVPGEAQGSARVLETPAPLDRHIVMGPTQSGGGALAWFSDRFLGGDIGRAIALAAEVPAGARGVVFLPYLEGERAPIWDERARGVFFGLSTAHGPAEFARAILEGVAAGDRQVRDAVEETAGVRIERLRVAGGARDGLWGQIKADMLGVPLELTSEQPGTLGAAMLAGVAAGAWTDVDEASRAVVRVTSRIEPRPELQPASDAVFETYRALYPRLKDLYRG